MAGKKTKNEFEPETDIPLWAPFTAEERKKIVSMSQKVFEEEAKSARKNLYKPEEKIPVPAFDPWIATSQQKREVYRKYRGEYVASSQDDEIFQVYNEKDVQESEQEPTGTLPDNPDDAYSYHRLAAWGYIQDAFDEIVDSNNKLAGAKILQCIDKALDAEISIPRWLRFAFSSRVWAVLGNIAKGWSDSLSFGPAREKLKQFDDEFTYREHAQIMHHYITRKNLSLYPIFTTSIDFFSIAH